MNQHEINQRNVKALCRPHTRLIDELLVENPGIVLDLGACDGGYVQHWLDGGATEVHAFEPTPWHFDVLKKAFKKNKRVFPHMIAVSDKAGRVEGALVFNAHTLALPGQTTLAEAAENPGRKFDFDLTTVDAFVMKQGIRAISLIKLDVDGYEPAALRGMQNVLAAFRPPIMIELSGLPKALGENCAAMIDFLYAQGYKICTMDGEVCDNPHAVMEYYPWHTSFDVAALPIENIPAKWPRVT